MGSLLLHKKLIIISLVEQGTDAVAPSLRSGTQVMTTASSTILFPASLDNSTRVILGPLHPCMMTPGVNPLKNDV